MCLCIMCLCNMCLRINVFMHFLNLTGRPCQTVQRPKNGSLARFQQIEFSKKNDYVILFVILF